MKKPQINKKTVKKINNFKQSVVDGFNTLFTVVKIVGGGTGGAYLLINGIAQNNVVFMALGAVISAYSIIVLVPIAHIATKSARA